MRAIQGGYGYTVEEGTECWIAEERASTGYGPYLAFYEASFGEIPEGMEVGHMCRGGPRGCVRPSHLDIWPAGSRISHVPDPAIAPAKREEFRERIEMEREARCATKKQFAAELGVAQSTYADWARGVSAPTHDVYTEIAAKLGWDGHVRRFEVIVAVERIVPARSAGEAARAVLAELTVDGQPLKAKIVRARVRA